MAAVFAAAADTVDGYVIGAVIALACIAASAAAVGLARRAADAARTTEQR